MARAHRCGRRRARVGVARPVEVRTERLQVAGVPLTLARPVAPEALIDEEAFADDEFLPYWAELWPAARALAEALPEVSGLRSSSSDAGSACRPSSPRRRGPA